MLFRTRLMLIIIGLSFFALIGASRSDAQSGMPIYYISCLLNGVGPGVDLRPFAITNSVSGERSTIPVGTQVIRVTDETGQLVPPDEKGRVLILWKNTQWWIVPAALKQPAADGSTDCDGHITPVPTITAPPSPQPSPTLVVPPTKSAIVTSAPISAAPTETSVIATPTQETMPTNDPALPVYGKGRFDIPDVHGIFGNQPAAVIGTYRIYDNGTVDLVPRSVERCVDTVSPASIFKCDTTALNAFTAEQGIAVYAPVAGCAIRLAEQPSIVVLVVNCETNITLQDNAGAPVRGRRELVLAHLDPDSIKRLSTGGTQVKAGEQLGTLCINATKADCDISADILPYLSVQLRINTVKGKISATKDEILAVLGTPYCIYDDYLYNIGAPTQNADPLQGCAEQ